MTIGEVRQGRNFIRKGDPIRVRLPGKTQYRDGFVFLGWDEKAQRAEVRLPTGGWRMVPLDSIRRKAVSRSGGSR